MEAQAFLLTVLPAATSNLWMNGQGELGQCWELALLPGLASPPAGLPEVVPGEEKEIKKEKRKEKFKEQGVMGSGVSLQWSIAGVSSLVLVSWPNPTVPAGFLFKQASSLFSWSSFWQRSAGTGFLLFKARREFAEGKYSSGWRSGKTS